MGESTARKWGIWVCGNQARDPSMGGTKENDQKRETASTMNVAQWLLTLPTPTERAPIATLWPHFASSADPVP